jgi:G8 domain
MGPNLLAWIPRKGSHMPSVKGTAPVSLKMETSRSHQTKPFLSLVFRLTLGAVLCAVASAPCFGGGSEAATAGHASEPVDSCTATLCSCTTGALPNGNGQDLEIYTGTCVAHAGLYRFHNVNIYGGGQLMFMDDGDTDFWAESILIENKGSLTAGKAGESYGTKGTLTIHLYGKAQGTTGAGGRGIPCLSDKKNQCGVPDKLWTSNCPGNDCSQPMKLNPTSCVRAKDVVGFNQNLPGKVDDCFYAYMPLTYDGAGTPPGYFGYKVLAVSYGGTLQLFGMKGAVDDPQMANSSGTSWARLTTTLKGNSGEKTFTVDREVNWKGKDQIVIATTDYLPGHSEVVTLDGDAVNKNGMSIIHTKEVIANPHYGETYKFPASLPNDVGPDQKFVDTRAAVALLTRSIRILSGGDKLLDKFPDEPNKENPPPATISGDIPSSGRASRACRFAASSSIRWERVDESCTIPCTST